jgi:hypothetical protein
MKTIQQEQYTKLNKALHELEDILSCMGIKEYSLSKNRHKLELDPNGDDIDTDLLCIFCHKIQQMHDAKFGQGYLAA